MRFSLAVVLSTVLGLAACDRTTLGISSKPGVPIHADQGGPERAVRDAGPEPDLGGAVEPAPDAAGEASTPDSAAPLEAAPPDLVPDAPPDLTPDVQLVCPSPPAHEWLGCVASCGACDTVLAPFDLYFQHHPTCQHGGTSCTGAYTSCPAECPLPSGEDASCLPLTEGSWNGCRESGCAVDASAVAAYPGYFHAHPFCSPGSGSGPLTGCARLCPPPTEDERVVQDGVSGGWEGCRGYGSWACVELLGGYPRYFQNHPSCVANTTCAGQFATCSDVCPAPTKADR
jgi:hypothetical protein